MKYVIFDDQKWENFFPLTLTRSTGDLRVGILKLRQRISAYFELDKTNLIIFSSLEKIYRERHPEWIINLLSNEDTIFINSRLKVDDELVEAINNLDENTCLVHKKEVLAFRTQPEVQKISSEEIAALPAKLEKIKWEPESTWNYTWELIAANSKYIERDFQDFFYDKDNYFETEQGTTVINPYNVWLGEGTKLAPGVVLDATEGPIILDENVKIMPNAVLVGPVYVGKNSVIKIGAKIYEGTSVGPNCKIGGEVEETIIQAYTNKQHDGFLGHSYLGEWINIGADTNNSDLRNDYGNVSMFFYPQNKKVDTKQQSVGTVIGDHSKTGINCTINIGAVIGVDCNLFGRDLIINHVPSFRWGTMSTLIEHEIDKFCETAKAVKARRNQPFTVNEKELYSNIHQIVFGKN
ncbi:MAG: putative sugar nucleotidyl transferase [Candidatus Cloacimonadales bacterium]|nr:putative sugar nucleotidyl transferase [Candidatus Cloacimonadales bacterium]